MVDKITGLSGMRNLRILSLGRNYIKQISGLEAVAETLEELWLSYNLIEKLKGLSGLKKLRVLYLSNNQVKDWVEFNRLQEIPTLENLLFIGNPLVEGMDEALWKAEITKVTTGITATEIPEQPMLRYPSIKARSNGGTCMCYVMSCTCYFVYRKMVALPRAT